MSDQPARYLWGEGDDREPQYIMGRSLPESAGAIALSEESAPDCVGKLLGARCFLYLATHGLLPSTGVTGSTAFFTTVCGLLARNNVPNAFTIPRHSSVVVWRLESMPAHMGAVSVIYTRITAIGTYGGRRLDRSLSGFSRWSAVGATQKSISGVSALNICASRH